MHNIAQLNRTFVVGLKNFYRLVDTLSKHARVYGTCVIIIAVHGGVNASFDCIAAIDGARIIVVANSLFVLASKEDIAGVDGALVVVVAISWNMFAFSAIQDARVNGTSIVVVAVLWNSNQSFSECASGDNAFVLTLFVDSFNIDRSVLATQQSIAGVNSARILVIADDGFVFDLSVSVVAPISSASILVININRLVDAAKEWTAWIDSARIVVVTVNSAVNTSHLRNASSTSTSIAISAVVGYMSAISGIGVARIDSARIIIIAVTAKEFAFSSCRNTSACNARICGLRAFLWSEDAFSFKASIISACVVIVANNSRVEASHCRVASSKSASSPFVAFDWGVLDSKLRMAPISCASIPVIHLCRSERNEYTSVLRIAGVNSARVVVVADNRSVYAFVCFKGASISSACILVVTVQRTNIDVLATEYSIARVCCAWIVVVANDSVVVYNSSSSVAPISCASIVVINIDMSEYTSFNMIAGIDSAWVVVVANNWSKDSSLVGIAGNSSAIIGTQRN
jgi:hypothetical protein